MIDGPFIVYDTSSSPTQVTDEEITFMAYPQAAGIHYSVSTEDYAANESAFAQYKVTPALLQRVFSGDDPANPTITVPLRFPDAATAQTVLAPLIPVEN